MNFFSVPFKVCIKQIQRRRLRQMMRGYRNLKKADRLDCIANIKRDLTKKKLNINEKLYSKYFFGAGIESPELVLRQYLLIRIGGTNLNKALLLVAGKANTRVSFSMPLEWVDIIEQYGFKVNKLQSILMWRLYVLMLLMIGILKIFKVIMASLNFLAKTQTRLDSYVYFAELNNSNLPKTTEFQSEHNIISWYVQWGNRKPNISTICHDVPTAFNKPLGDLELNTRTSPIPELTSLNTLIKYVGWALLSIPLAFIDFFRWRWWHPLLLNQSALSAQVRFTPPNFLAKEYLFHNSNWIYRPLWTYEAEKFGAIITFYFYSTNCESFRKGLENSEITYGWGAMSWPRYLVWDEYQADFVRRCVGNQGEILVVGPIWFSNDSAQLCNIPPKAVAVFDVQPVRDSFYNLLALDFEYYTPTTANQFLIDIRDVLTEAGCNMILKRKREIGKLCHPSYRGTLARLSNCKNYIAIDSQVAAQKVIQNCFAVISMPFTSTALLGKELKKPSIYYDPTGLLNKDDLAAHGIEILQGKGELKRWLQSTMYQLRPSDLAHV